MITRETAGKIWQCHREIDAAKELLANEKIFPTNDHRSWHELPVGRWTREGFELAVPKDETCKQLYGIKPDLAKSVIRAHLAAMEALLVELNEMALLEISEGAA